MALGIWTDGAGARLEAASRWLGAQKHAVLVVATTRDAARELCARAVQAHGPAMGRRPTTLDALARQLAAPELARRGLAPLSGAAWVALVARVTHALGAAHQLGRFAPLADKPGLPSALAATLAELALADLSAEEVSRVDPDLSRLHAAVRIELPRAGLADRALLFEAATGVAASERYAGAAPSVLALDLPLASPLEAEFLSALVRAAPAALFTWPSVDRRARAQLTDRLGELELLAPEDAASGALSAVHATIASGAAPQRVDSTRVEILSAPGEARECIELARRALAAARVGTPFSRMAVLLRAPELYRAHVTESFRAAGIPLAFSRGTRRPDPGGRALLALLECALSGLSARAFAEYLSLGVVPDADAAGAPPAALLPGERWAPEDPDAEGERDLRDAAEAEYDESSPVVHGTLRAPRRWERLLVEAAVVGGASRWERRLMGLERELERAIGAEEEPDGNRARALTRDLSHLRALRDFALPLIADLAALPAQAPWRAWLDRLSALATRALRFPRRVLAVLASLAPMAEVGPVSLSEVRAVLTPRLRDESVPDESLEGGAIAVCTVDEARGREFDLVLLPGLAERVFPRKVIEDPILLDAKRAALCASLDDDAARADAERARLAIAVGAASERLVVSYPRLDVERGRGRVPSFYALEIARASTGTLPGLAELSREAEARGAAHLGWPAPEAPEEAITLFEHDLSTLARLARMAPSARRSGAHHIVSSSPHAARALRARWMRWDTKRWRPLDGLVDKPGGGVAAVLADHLPETRAYSATGLESFAACPYRFYLRNVVRLEPREGLDAITELDPAQRGTLIHDVFFAFITRMRDEARLPVTQASEAAARDTLDEVLDEIATRHHEELAPAIERVWDAGIETIRKDLREWLHRSGQASEWVATHAELAFGLPGEERDAASLTTPVVLTLSEGTLRLRGSIDLVERSGETFRATDHKTGSARVKSGAVVEGGKMLQPLLYALALEAMFPETSVVGGRLYYCTAKGGFSEVEVALDEAGRRAIGVLHDAVSASLREAFFPAAPNDGCRFCDFQIVCGPREETRSALKPREDPRLGPVVTLRAQR